MRMTSDLLSGLNVIWPVQSGFQKDSVSRSTQINSIAPPSRPPEGRIAIVTDAGWDAVDAGSVGRDTWIAGQV